jgi:hypothetical protein
MFNRSENQMLPLATYYTLKGERVRVLCVSTLKDMMSNTYDDVVTYTVIESNNPETVGENFTMLLADFSRWAQSAPNVHWIGVDLDGTLVNHDQYIHDCVVGDPIVPMLNRVRVWLAQGIKVKIMTARASSPSAIRAIQAWLVSHGLPVLEVTDTKDYAMRELWDDRGVTVLRNHGTIITQHIKDPNAEESYLGMDTYLRTHIYPLVVN